jgi:DNA polymerase-3 subunit delta
VVRGEPGSFYGIFGEEDFLVGLALETFFSSSAFAANFSLNVERFLAGETSPGRVLESARTLPFLGKRRLVVVKNCNQYKAEQLGEFLPYLEDPAPTTCLVFSGTKLDQRLRFAKALDRRGRLHVYKRLYPKQVVPWLAERARLRGKWLAPEAAAQLSELTALGLGALDSELEKLSLFVGGRKQIVPLDVAAVTGRGQLYSIFDLTDALAAGRLERALSAYNQLDSLGEPAVRVLAMLMRLFRQISSAREIIEHGGGLSQVQQELRLPPTAARTIFTRAERSGARELAAYLRRLLAADIALKSSPGADKIIIENLIMDLCAAQPASARRQERLGVWGLF